MGVEAPAFTDLAACLDAVRPEGVWIASPQSTHRALFEICLQRRVPVFCEKPLAHTLDDARAMVELAARHPEVPVAVGFMLAHNPLFDRAAELLAAGAIGQPRAFKASCRLSQVFQPMKGWTFTREAAGGGVLINSGCHLLYVLDRLFGRPAGCTARGRGVHNEVEDVFDAMIDFPAGLFGTLEVTWSVPGHETQTHDVEVIGTGGVVQVGNEWLRLWLRHAAGDHPAGWSQWARHEVAPRAAFSLSPDYCGDEFFLEDQDFIDAVHQKRAPKVDIARAWRIQQWLEMLYRAAESGKYTEMPPEA
jgi:predicted dehydrogenase